MKCQSLFSGKIFLSSAEIFTQMQSGNQLRVLIFFSYFSTKTNIMVFISKWTFFLYDLYIFCLDTTQMLGNTVSLRIPAIVLWCRLRVTLFAQASLSNI